MPNVPLLEKTMDYIVCHPEEHYQMVWACGTVRCFAGTALMLEGYAFRTINDEELGSFGTGGACVVPAHDALAFRNQGEFLASTQAVAARTLDLTEDQAKHLFHATRTIPELQLAVKDIVNEQLI